MNRVYFTADLHFGHAAMLKHSLKRPFAEKDETTAHDEWLLDLWWRTVDCGDTVYILGDLTGYRDEAARDLLEKLPGRKYLIEGNHDKAVNPFHNYFEEVCQLKEVKFKKGDYSFLQGNFQVVMCHYPLLTWNNKRKGTVMLHGHCHGALDKFNAWSPDLRYDVGLDSQMANLHFVKLEEIYQAAMEKRNLA